MTNLRLLYGFALPRVDFSLYGVVCDSYLWRYMAIRILYAVWQYCAV